MKEKIHPEYFKDAIFRCACGNEVILPSTKKEVRVDICSTCHPFYSGEAKKTGHEISGGRLERFRKKYKR